MGPLAEALGYDSVWVMDHLLNSGYIRERLVSGRASSPRAASRPRLPGDDPDQMIAGIEAYERAGVEHIVLALNPGDLAHITGLMVSIAEKVMPHCRQVQGS